jgi:hypothetical protein
MSDIFLVTSTEPISIIVTTLDRIIMTCSNAINFVQILLSPVIHKDRVDSRSLTTLNNSKFKLRMPIQITITETQDEVIAEFPEAEIAVSEDTIPLALAWMKRRIIGSYIRFKASRDKLGPVPTRQLHVLEKYIVEQIAKE